MTSCREEEDTEPACAETPVHDAGPSRDLPNERAELSLPTYGACGQATCREGPRDRPGAMRITAPANRSTSTACRHRDGHCREPRGAGDHAQRQRLAPGRARRRRRLHFAGPSYQGRKHDPGHFGEPFFERRHRYGRSHNAAIWSELTWGGPGDIDFHLYLPYGGHCYYQNKSVGGAVLDVDNTSGYGPEHITMENAPPGEYRLSVLYYSGSGETPPPVSWRVTIRLRDGEVQQSFSGTLGSVKAEQTVTTFRF